MTCLKKNCVEPIFNTNLCFKHFKQMRLNLHNENEKAKKMNVEQYKRLFQRGWKNVSKN